MFFFKILVQCLLLGATTAFFAPERPVEGISLEQEHKIMDRNDISNGKTELKPTATIPIHKTFKSNIADAPSPTQSELISTCDAYYFVESGDYCSGIVSKFGNFTLSQFYSWNPAVKSDCSELLAGYYVCIGVAGTSTTSATDIIVPTATNTPAPAPSPTQTGIASNCNDYYKVLSGDTCVGISNSNNITLTDFYDWNRAVGSSCQILIAGYYVCVGVSDSSSITTTTITITTATATAIVAPSPTQTGIVSGCTKYYQAQKGDTCVTIVNDHYPSLTVTQFESWNPAVGTSCNGLLTGYYYCVAA